MKICNAVAIVCVSCFTQMSIGAASEPNVRSDWTSFRNGGHSKAVGALPLEWSAEAGIAWQKELAGYGQSTPVIYGGKVYVTSVVGPMKEVGRVTCLDLDSGKVEWSAEMESETQGESNYMHSRAAPTPVVDRGGVYAFFEGGNLVCLSHEGERRWQTRLSEAYGPFENNHGLGSSLAQSDKLLFLNLEHRGPSRLVAIEKKDGKARWQVERPSGSSWSSPIVFAHGDSESVIVSSAGSVTAYEVSSGEQQWALDGLEGNSVPSPTIAGTSMLIGARLPEFGSTSDASRSNLCLTLNDDGDWDVRWRAKKVFSDYASPVVAGGYVYYLNKAGVLFCLDVETGDSQYTQRLGVQCWATPLVADGHVYFFGKSGETVVIKAGPSFEKVALNRLWDTSDPPKPESYVEYQAEAGHGHGTGGASGGRRRGAMLASMLQGDANKDGVLTQAELPKPFQAMFGRLDLNGDGALDGDELKAMEESFRKRREGSREGARDPIVYGIAAADGTIVIRTGTRLYAICSSAKAVR